jgi:hypothetical protein
MTLSHYLHPSSKGKESVIQDVAIPFAKAGEFLHFLLTEIGILPIWLCPFRASQEAPSYSLYPVEAGLYINFGFWDVVPAHSGPDWRNRQVEHATHELGGRKALYSSSFYDPESFLSLYDHQRYQVIKQRCDPAGILGDLYSKCVRAS